ncbi:MAG: GNAT family N-acetyltransferase [Lachnospiraceae bacterium]|nr:GNAT family N-acetyltransferase [Lachnospiraceae bacterium]
MPRLHILTNAADKQITRPLYEQAFDDPKAFVDYYYAEKCRDNVMIVLRDAEGKVLSMLHLNPYTLSVCGKEVPSYYVVAVATDAANRRKGYMAKVLAAADDYMRKAHIPFCFLLPVDEAIYRDFGYETICDFVTRDDKRAALSYEDIKKGYDVYCVRDALYLKRMEAEDDLAKEGDSEVLPENPVMMAHIVDRAACARLLSEPRDASEKALLAKLKSLRCYFREEV